MIRLSRRRIRAILGRGCVAAAISGPWFARAACAQEAIAPPADPGFVATEPVCPPSPPVCGPMAFVAPLEPRRETFVERLRSIRRRCSWNNSTTHCNKMYWDASPYWIPNYGYHPTTWRRGACEPGYDPYLPTCPAIGLYAPADEIAVPTPSQSTDSDYSPKSVPPEPGQSPPPAELDAPQPKSLPAPRSEPPALPPGATSRKESPKEPASVAVKLDSNPTPPAVPPKEQTTHELAASSPSKNHGIQGAVLSAVIQPEAEPALASNEATKQSERPSADVQRSSFVVIAAPTPADSATASEKAPVPNAAHFAQPPARQAAGESKGTADVTGVAKTPREKAGQAELPATATKPVVASAGGRESTSNWRPHHESPDQKIPASLGNLAQTPPIQRAAGEDPQATSVQQSSPPDGKPNWQPHWRPTSHHENAGEIRSTPGESVEPRNADSFTLPGVASGRTKGDVTRAVKRGQEMSKGSKRPGSSETVMRGCMPLSGSVAKGGDSAGGWRPTGRRDLAGARTGLKPDDASGPEVSCHRVIASDAIVRNADSSADALPPGSAPGRVQEATGAGQSTPGLFVRRADLARRQTGLASHEEEHSKEALLRLHSSKIPLAPVQTAREAPAVCFVDTEPDIFPLDSQSARTVTPDRVNSRMKAATPQEREAASPSSSEAATTPPRTGATSPALTRSSTVRSGLSELRTGESPWRQEAPTRPRSNAGVSNTTASPGPTAILAERPSAQAQETSDARPGAVVLDESATSVDRWFTDGEPRIFPLSTARPVSRITATSSGAVQAAYTQQDRTTRAQQASHEVEPRARGPVYISTHPFVEGERSAATAPRPQDDEKVPVKRQGAL